MKKLLLLPAAIMLFSALAFVQNATSDKAEAKKGFEYLNKVRQNPAAYSKEIGADLSDVKKLHSLKWNDTLAKVAEAKALDMAKRNYFGHVDPDGNGINLKINQAGYKLDKIHLSHKSDNSFESISAGNTDCVEAIKSLILDQGLNPPMHRHHLLGINPFWGECPDIGIGYAKAPDSQYGTYVCVIIAKHN